MACRQHKPGMKNFNFFLIFLDYFNMWWKINLKNKKINIFLNKETFKNNSIIVSNDVEVAVRCLCTKHFYFSNGLRLGEEEDVTTAMWIEVAKE